MRDDDDKDEATKPTTKQKQSLSFFETTTHHFHDVRRARAPRRGVPQPDLAHVVARGGGERAAEGRKGHGDRRRRRQASSQSFVIVRSSRRVEHGPGRLEAAQKRLVRAVVAASRRGREQQLAPRRGAALASVDGCPPQDSKSQSTLVAAISARGAERSHLADPPEGTGEAARHA